MRTVSMQGLQLSPGQRRQIEQQRQVRAFMNPVLQESVDRTIAELDRRKDEGVKEEPQNKVIFRAKGTISIAEWMGF